MDKCGGWWQQAATGQERQQGQCGAKASPTAPDGNGFRKNPAASSRQQRAPIAKRLSAMPGPDHDRLG